MAPGATQVNSASRIEWNHYTSQSLAISFDYPEDWIVTDRTFTDEEFYSPKTTLTYLSLWVCPSTTNLISSAKEGNTNCVQFYTRSRILHPPLAFEDESTIFDNVMNYVNDKSNNYSSFIVLEPGSPIASDPNINLVGLYRDKASVMGLYQAICPDDQIDECILVFNHILGSIRLLD